MSVASDIFELGEAGYSRVKRADELDFTEADLPRLQAARDMCPTGAISIETVEETADEPQPDSPEDAPP